MCSVRLSGRLFGARSAAQQTDSSRLCCTGRPLPAGSRDGFAGTLASPSGLMTRARVSTPDASPLPPSADPAGASRSSSSNAGIDIENQEFAAATTDVDGKFISPGRCAASGPVMLTEAETPACCSICLAPLEELLATEGNGPVDEGVPPPAERRPLCGHESALVELNCSHVYHRSCIAGWLQHEGQGLQADIGSFESKPLRSDVGSCPLCRASIELATLPGCHPGCYAYPRRDDTTLQSTGEISMYHVARCPNYRPLLRKDPSPMSGDGPDPIRLQVRAAKRAEYLASVRREEESRTVAESLFRTVGRRQTAGPPAGCLQVVYGLSIVALLVAAIMTT